MALPVIDVPTFDVELPTSKDLRENPQLLQKILNYGKNSNGSS